MARRTSFAVCLTLLLAAPATAGLVNENLLVVVPDGYKIDFRDKSAKMLVN
jgi:hypothetical protein